MTTAEPEAALEDAAKVTVCGLPGCNVSEDGVAVTPPGKPLNAMFTTELNPLIAVTLRAIAAPVPPALMFAVDGLALNEKSGAGTTLTFRAKLAVCEREPDVPVSVTVLELADADALAVNVMLCGVPGIRLNDEGVAVTPAGRPEIATETVPLKPLLAFALTATCWLPDPAVRAMLAGDALREKSGAGAMVTLRARGIACEREPEVPVSVTVPEPAAAFAPAVSVMVCATPGIRLSDTGEAVTPAGRPEIATETIPLKPLIAVALTETCWLPDPAVSATLPDDALREKSATVVSAGLAPPEPHPATPKVMQVKASNTLKLTTREIGFRRPRVLKSMRLASLPCAIRAPRRQTQGFPREGNFVRTSLVFTFPKICNPATSPSGHTNLPSRAEFEQRPDRV